ncbi:hypothetical protein [Saccharothrix sp. NRRL B-16348]|uniref:hypothetical protein n=1 Tax=Saccharothrix sp. NRRL B-16348 TaxID=1415542 RepID=UPI0012F9083E|nr:hypothetical protein [Saccharothrix sp. NRRL B-16348]
MGSIAGAAAVVGTAVVGALVVGAVGGGVGVVVAGAVVLGGEVVVVVGVVDAGPAACPGSAVQAVRSRTAANPTTGPVDLLRGRARS